MQSAVLSSQEMPMRFKVLAALLLAIIVCLVLVLPQIDLDDGVLRDVPNQILLLAVIAFAASLIRLMRPQSYFSREAASANDIALQTGACTGSILRC